MNLKNKPPIFVPRQFMAEIEKLPKAALMDLVWDYAQRCAATEVMNDDGTMAELRKSIDLVLTHRRQAA